MTTKERYINPYTDFGFKKLFGSEVNKDLLIDFLNELIKEQGRITDVQFLKSEQVGRSENDRKAIFDIFCKSETGERFIVEMQRAKQNYFKDRSVFYSTFPIRDQAQQGNWNYKLNAVYFIGILDFSFDKDDKNYFHHEVKLMEIHRKEVFYDKLSFIYLEMPKFDKKEEELETHFDKWLYVLKNLPSLESRPAKLQERVFERLFRIAEIAQFTPQEMDDYESSLKVYRDNFAVIETALEEGYAKGEEKGMEKGIEVGMEKRNMEIAHNSLKANVPIETIMQITGLTEEQIKNIN
jgi:predicted transposase/invertase (TIGR01784 family)